MYYKCNSKRNGMLALIRFSDTFYLVVAKPFFIPLIKLGVTNISEMLPGTVLVKNISTR